LNKATEGISELILMINIPKTRAYFWVSDQIS